MERKREKIMYLICFLSKLMNMFLVTVHIRIQNQETGVIEGEKKKNTCFVFITEASYTLSLILFLS